MARRCLQGGRNRPPPTADRCDSCSQAAPSGNPEFKKWHRDTEVAITYIFGKDGRHLEDFNSIGYSLTAFSSATPDSAFEEAYRDGLDR